MKSQRILKLIVALAALLSGCAPATLAPTAVATLPPSPPATAVPNPTTSAPPAETTTVTEPAPTASPAPTATKRPLPRVQNTAVFGASAGLVWNFIALEEGVMQLEVEADPNAFTEQPTPVTSDGAGIEKVVFVVNAPDGSTITLEETEPAYCLLGGNGPCDGFPLEGDTFVWPGGPAVQSGDYSVNVTIYLSDGQTRDLFGSFTLELP